MTVNSLMEFAKMLNVRMKRHDRQVQRTNVRPFIRIIASLSAPDIIFDPTPQDIAKTIAGKVLKGVLESTKHFFRWYRQSCVEVQRPVCELALHDNILIYIISNLCLIQLKCLFGS